MKNEAVSNNRHYNVVVIGAGIAGIGCAAMLDPSISVLVLEREPHCGYHSTGRSAAIFIPSYGGPIIRELTRRSEAYLRDAPDDPAVKSYLTRRGELILATRDEEETLVKLLTEAPTLEEISIADALQWVPILKPGLLHRVAADTTARDIDVDLLLNTWRNRLLQKNTQRNNCAIATNQEVLELRRPDQQGPGAQDAGAKNWTVVTREGRYHADVVVNAAGAWADTIAQLAKLKPKNLTPCRRSAALIPAPSGYNVDVWPAFASATETWYAKPSGGKLMVSPADEDPVEPHDAFADDLVLAEGIDRYEQAVTVPVTHVEHSWAGLRTFAPDRNPVVGFDDEADGFFWLAGHGGYGIQTAPALSTLAASLVAGNHAGEELTDMVQALSPGRELYRY